jgi:hypothetical protein
MSESLKFEGTFDSGIRYQVHTMNSFSGMEELALMIEGKPVVVLTVTKKKNGSAEVKPVMAVKVRLPAEGKSFQEQPRESEPVSPPQEN